MNVLICICSKYPNPHLHKCIDELYKKQINRYIYTTVYKIHIVDSDSEDLSYYKQIQEDFPEVEIHMIKNKNYEYGAWKYIIDKYPCFDTYFCIQDTIIINRYIDLNVLNEKTAFTFHDHRGYNSHPFLIVKGSDNLIGSGLNYEPIINTNFTVASFCSFIVNNKVMKDIFKHLKIPPVDKDGSCFYERNFGIFFLDKQIRTLDLFNYMTKINTFRN